MSLTAVPRTTVNLALTWLRLPLSAAQVVTGQRDKTWPPAIVFGGFEASIKQIAGSLLRDDALLDEGRLQQAEMSELRHATDLDVEADQIRTAAEVGLRAERAAATHQRLATDQETQRKQAAIDDQQRATQRHADQVASDKAAAAAEAAEKREKRAAATERQARLTSVGQETQALHQERRATQATRAAQDAADKLEAKKDQRKTS